MTPMEALRCATAVPAAFLGMEAEVGTIQAGKRADLVLLAADPLADIANTRRIDTVIANGEVFDPPRREQLLSDLAKAFASSLESPASSLEP